MVFQLLALCFLCVCIWRLLLKKKATLEPPELSGKLPIVGHAHMIMGASKRVYTFIKKCSGEALEKGGVITINLGLRKSYVVTDPEDSLTVINTCLNKHYVYNFTKSLLGNGLLNVDASTWKKNRKLLNPAFNQQVLDSFIEIFNTQAQILVDRFAKEVEKQFDHEQIMQMNNLESICATSFGIIPEEYSNLLSQYVSQLKIILIRINERIQKFWLHSDFIYNMTQHKKNLDEEIKTVYKLSNLIIQQKKSERKNIIKKEEDTGKFKTFIDLILDLANDSGFFTDKQILDETNNIMVAGHETVAQTLTIALTILGSHTDVQEKAYEETLRILGKTVKNIDKDTLSKLTYIEAILNEILRLYPVIPIVGRRIDKDVKIKNYTIKANSDCFISIYGIHRHSIWGPDANQFRPERWLDKKTLPDLKYFCAFGLGRRACIGRVYAMMSMKITLAHVLQKYRISSDSNKMVLKINLTVKVDSGHEITLTPRDISDNI